jgi:hypothetical protein
MEETNYNRTVVVSETIERESIIESKSADTMNTSNAPVDRAGNAPQDESSGQMSPSRKTYLQKLRLGAPRQGRRDQLWRSLKQPLYFLTWPTIVWAGFLYGSNLIWFNVLNATASLILSSPPYSFSAAMVGVTFISAFLGTIVA